LLGVILVQVTVGFVDLDSVDGQLVLGKSVVADLTHVARILRWRDGGLFALVDFGNVFVVLLMADFWNSLIWELSTNFRTVIGIINLIWLGRCVNNSSTFLS